MKGFLHRFEFFGFKYVKRRRGECQLLNFLLGPAKMAVYINRKNQIEQRNDSDVVRVFTAMVKSRIVVDLNFYKIMNNLVNFESMWCYRETLCSVVNRDPILVLSL